MNSLSVPFLRPFRRAFLASALALVGAQALAASVIVQSSSLGTLNEPFTSSFGAVVAPLTNTGDTFISEYGFSVSTDSSFSSAVTTFGLGSTLQLSDLTLTLLSGSNWAGTVPTSLSATQLQALDASIVAQGSGNDQTQTISAITLPAGSYTIEVQGVATGTNGGSFAGVVNLAGVVSPVPEPASSTYAIAGLAVLLAWNFLAGRLKSRR